MSEFDGFMDNRDFALGENGFRHYPGPGSSSMAFIVHPRMRGAVRSVDWAGRNGRLRIKQECVFVDDAKIKNKKTKYSTRRGL